MKSARLASAVIAFLLMITASVVAALAVPTRPMADAWADASLDKMLPERFGEWQIDLNVVPVAADPTATAALAQVYTETVARTYISPSGARIMLSVAYGRDQRGEGRAHYPEVCYPAQGFQVGQSQPGVIDLDDRQVSVNTLVAKHGARVEPITYWMVVGSRRVLTSLQHKTTILSYGFGGEIADGLLFRISSIDRDRDRAYEAHGEFARALYSHLSPEARKRFFGTSSAS